MATRRPPRRLRSDGERSRSAILEASAKLATVEGLRGLSIGALAQAIGMSKSGLYAHFGSKEELQLATIDTAGEIFAEKVVRPGESIARPLERLRSLLDLTLEYFAGDVFPGGCFFAAAEAEWDTHPGPIRDVIAGFMSGWIAKLAECITQAQAAGELDRSEDPTQLAFELNAMLVLANSTYVMFRDPSAFERARRGIERLLASAGA